MIVRPGFREAALDLVAQGASRSGRLSRPSAAAFGGVWTIGTPPARTNAAVRK